MPRAAAALPPTAALSLRVRRTCMQPRALQPAKALIVRSVTLGQVADVYGLGLSRPDEVLEGHMSPLLHLWLAWGLLNALPQARALLRLAGCPEEASFAPACKAAAVAWACTF